MNANTFKRLARSENVNLFVFTALIVIVIVAGAAVYYTARLPATSQYLKTPLKYKQIGHFSYVVYMRPNSIYETTELGPGQSYFTNLTEAINVTFRYDLDLETSAEDSQPVVQEQSFEYEVVAQLQDSEAWSREFVLVPRSSSRGELERTFIVPIEQYKELLELVRKEASTSGRDAKLVVEARVWPKVETQFGDITEPFVHALQIDWNTSSLSVSNDDDLEQVQAGAITENERVRNDQTILYRRLSGLGLALSTLILLGWAAIRIWAVQGSVTPEDIIHESKRIYSDQLVEAISVPPPTAGQTVIQLRSMDDLGKTATELMKPIVVVPEADGYRCVVIDNMDGVRYEYVVQAESTELLKKTMLELDREESSSPDQSTAAVGAD